MTNETTTWQCIDTEPFTGGNSGGDRQVGDDVTVRFRPTVERADGLHALIEETWYAERYDDPDDEDTDPEYGVMCRVWYAICTDPDDPGGTEVWSDHEYDDQADVFSKPSEEAAMGAVKRLAEQSVASGAQYYQWDGRTPLRAVEREHGGSDDRS